MAKHDTYSFKGGNIVVDIGWENIAAWQGMPVSVCKWCGKINPCCISNAIAETLLAAVATISYNGSEGGAESANTNMRCLTTLYDNVTDLYLKEHNILFGKGLFNITFYSSDATLNKRDSSIYNFVPPHIVFSSKFGKHIAVHADNGSLHDLALSIAEATPGKPLIKSNSLKKVDKCLGMMGLN